jgi:hypothetical protein
VRRAATAVCKPCMFAPGSLRLQRSRVCLFGASHIERDAPGGPCFAVEVKVSADGLAKSVLVQTGRMTADDVVRLWKVRCHSAA